MIEAATWAMNVSLKGGFSGDRRQGTAEPTQMRQAAPQRRRHPPEFALLAVVTVSLKFGEPRTMNT